MQTTAGLAPPRTSPTLGGISLWSPGVPSLRAVSTHWTGEGYQVLVVQGPESTQLPTLGNKAI